jgi:hypothetical protein
MLNVRLPALFAEISKSIARRESGPHVKPAGQFVWIVSLEPQR